MVANDNQGERDAESNSVNTAGMSRRIHVSECLEARSSAGKGLGVLATRVNAPATRILSESSACVIRKDSTHIADNDVQAAFLGMSPNDQTQFDDLHIGTRPFPLVILYHC